MPNTSIKFYSKRNFKNTLSVWSLYLYDVDTFRLLKKWLHRKLVESIKRNPAYFNIIRSFEVINFVQLRKRSLV